MLDESFLLFGGGKKKKKKEDTKKKKFLDSADMNVGRRSLGIVFACAIIYTVKRRIGLVLRSGAIHSVGTI